MSNLKNHTYIQETISFKKELERAFLVLAERLLKIRDERLYAGEYECFEDFLKEMDLSPSTASKLIGVYEKFVVIGGLDPEEVGRQSWTNLSLFLPLIKTKADARRIYDKTHLLNRTDAQRTYQEMKSGVDMAKCDHSNSYVLKVCRDCGLKMEQL